MVSLSSPIPLPRSEAAQATGHVDRVWEPADLIALLIGIGLAWANSPHPDSLTDDPAIIARRRAAPSKLPRIIATTDGQGVPMPVHETAVTVPDLGQSSLWSPAPPLVSSLVWPPGSPAPARRHMAITSRTKGERAVTHIRATVPDRQADHQRTRPGVAASSVSALGEELNDEGRPIDLLGQQRRRDRTSRAPTTPDGFELQFAANHLGHFALTGLLLPLREGRAVTTGCHRQRHGRPARRIQFSDLQFEHGYSPMRAYGQSKLANLIFARELNRRSREAGWGLLSNAAHPGISKPDPSFSGQESTEPLGERFMQVGQRLLPFMWQEISEGIKPALYAATSPEAAGGAFYGPHGFLEAAGGGAAGSEDPEPVPRAWPTPAGCGRSPEQLTGVTYPEQS